MAAQAPWIHGLDEGGDEGTDANKQVEDDGGGEGIMRGSDLHRVGHSLR